MGVHREAERPFRFLLEGPFRPVGLVTLTPEAAAKVSGAVDLTSCAREAGVPVHLATNVNEPSCVAWIKTLRPDLLLVIGWTQLVRRELLSVPRVGLGFHASLLPRYRGRAPINWALIHGEVETGNTMIVLEAGADEGDIVAQRAIPIEDADDCATLYEKVAATEVDMLREILPLAAEGRMPRRKQDPSQATVMPKRRPEDGGIDWGKTSRQLFNWVRALTHPYPGAFTSLDSTRVFVWKVAPEAAGPERAGEIPGTVRVPGDGIPRVVTGDGWLRLTSVQREESEEVSGAAAARTWLTDGSVFR